MQDFYELFNIDRSATKEEMKRKLNNLQRIWLGRTNDSDLTRRQGAKDIMRMLQDAKDILLAEEKEVESDGDTDISNDADINNDLVITTEPIAEESFEIDEEADALSLIEQANDLIDYGRFEDAIIVATRATELDGLNGYAWSTLAQANYQCGDIDRALFGYKKAIELNPSEARFFYELGIIYTYELKDMEKALDCVGNCFQRDSKYFWCRFLNGYIQRKIRMFDDSVAILEELNREEPNNIEIRNQLAWSYNHKAFSLLHYNKKDDNYHIIAPEMIDPAASYLEKAIDVTESKANRAWFTEKYDWLLAGRAGKFVSKNLVYYIIPALGFYLMLKNGNLIFGIVFLAVLMVMVITSIEPQWKINRRNVGI